MSHCPVSNTSISSGLCPVRQLLDDGIEVGLGTDISGGYSASVLVAAREAAMVSRTLAALTPDVPETQEPPREQNPTADVDATTNTTTNNPKHSHPARDRQKLSVEECLHLATVGGATCLGLSDKIGGFEPGMYFDAQFVQLDDADADPTPTSSSNNTKNENKNKSTGPVELFSHETWDDKLAKWLFCGDDRNTKAVYVAGRCVKRLS